MTQDDIDMMKLYIFSSCFTAFIVSERSREFQAFQAGPEELAKDALHYARAGWKVFAESVIAKEDSQD